MLYSFNLRNYFKTYVPKHGNLTGHYEQSFAVPPDIDDVSEFWKLAHDLNLKLQVNRAFYSRLSKISQDEQHHFFAFSLFFRSGQLVFIQLKSVRY